MGRGFFLAKVTRFSDSIAPAAVCRVAGMVPMQINLLSVAQRHEHVTAYAHAKAPAAGAEIWLRVVFKKERPTSRN